MGCRGAPRERGSLGRREGETSWMVRCTPLPSARLERRVWLLRETMPVEAGTGSCSCLREAVAIPQRSIALSATRMPASGSAFVLAPKALGRTLGEVQAHFCSKVGGQGRRRCRAEMTSAIRGVCLRGKAPFKLMRYSQVGERVNLIRRPIHSP